MTTKLPPRHSGSNKDLPLFVNEDFRDLPLTPLPRLLGVPVFATPRAWTNGFVVWPIFLVASLIFAPNASLIERVVYVIAWTLLFIVTGLIHHAGHIMGGQRVGSPMDRLILTSTRGVNVYEGDQDAYPPRVHLSRALGGPLLNLAVGGATLLFMLITVYNPTLIVFSLMNLAYGFGSFAPIPSIDGEIIFRYLGK